MWLYVDRGIDGGSWDYGDVNAGVVLVVSLFDVLGFSAIPGVRVGILLYVCFDNFHIVLTLPGSSVSSDSMIFLGAYVC